MYSEFASKYIGTKQGTKKHKEIVDTYNSISPLPRGYKVKYTDSWCATFVSFVLLKCGAINPPFECSCRKMFDKATANKQVVKTPQIDDIIIYDWKNNGTLDHVGIISNISGDTLTVIEGNKSKLVSVRTISKKSSEIECYIRVKNSSNNTTNNTTTNSPDIDKIVNDVINGKYGNGETRKTNIEKLGLNYKEIQSKVNAKLKEKS